MGNKGDKGEHQVARQKALEFGNKFKTVVGFEEELLALIKQFSDEETSREMGTVLITPASGFL